MVASAAHRNGEGKDRYDVQQLGKRYVRRSLAQHSVGVLWDILDLHAGHSAFMALRAPIAFERGFRWRTAVDSALDIPVG